MFFVVNFTAAKQNLIVPAICVHEMNNVFQKFMNYSCNSNQPILFYYPVNGYENSVNLVPNFQAELSDRIQEHKEFCFVGKILKYFNDYDDAVAYLNHHRVQEPPVYNPNRVNERPIPLIEPVTEPFEQIFVQEDNGEAIEIKVETKPIIMDEHDEAELNRILFEENVDEQEPIAQDLHNDISNLSIDENLPAKEEVENVEKSTEDLNQSYEIVFEEIEKFPKPIICNELILPKHENDPISGNLAYATKKNGDRVYEIGGVSTIISKSILDKIRAWATLPFDQSQNIDGKLVQLLLVKIVGMTDLAAYNVSDNVKAFIEVFFAARVDAENIERYARFNEYIDKACAQYARKNNH